MDHFTIFNFTRNTVAACRASHELGAVLAFLVADIYVAIEQKMFGLASQTQTLADARNLCTSVTSP